MDAEKTINALDQSLAVLIQGTTERGVKLVDWIYLQAPDVIREILLWRAVDSFIHFVLGIFFIVGFIPLLIYILKKMYYFLKISEIQSENRPVFWIPAFALFIALSISTQINGWTMVSLDWLHIWIAPKSYLLEYISQLIK